MNSASGPFFDFAIEIAFKLLCIVGVISERGNLAVGVRVADLIEVEAAESRSKTDPTLYVKDDCRKNFLPLTTNVG